MEESEFYVLANTRSLEIVQGFLDNFLPERDEQAEDYPFLEYSDEPEKVFVDVSQLLARLVDSTKEEYGIYWEGLGESKVSKGMLFFTEDGSLILGAACHKTDALRLMRDVADLTGASFGVVSMLESPPESAEKFKMLCRQYSVMSLVEGEIQNV